MNRKKEYVLLVILGVIVLAAGRYLFQVWEDYHEAAVGYQKLQEFIIEKPDIEIDSLMGFVRSMGISWHGYRFRGSGWITR